MSTQNYGVNPAFLRVFLNFFIRPSAKSLLSMNTTTMKVSIFITTAATATLMDVNMLFILIITMLKLLHDV